MALVITGKVLDVSTETVQGGPNGSFQSTTISVLSGKARLEPVRVGRDFPLANLPKEGDETALEVVVSAYSAKGGAGYRLTALGLAAPAVSKHAA